MGKYGNQVNQQFTDMYSPLNIKFYSDILDKAQTNLNQGAIMQAKFLEDAYGLKHFDEATHKAQIANIESKVADLTNGDFISPANVIKGISKAGQEFAPYKNLVDKQIEEAKRQQEQKDRWGSNWIGNDVSTIQLTDPATGQLISPDKLKGISGNREDLIQALARDNAGRADAVTEIPGVWNTILGGQAYERKTKKIKGITEEQRLNEFVNNQRLAKQYMEQLPGFAEAVKASGMNPEEYIAKEIDTWSKQLVRGEETDSKFIDNKNYISAAERAQQDLQRPSPMSPTPGGVFKSNLSVGEQLKEMTGGKEVVDISKFTYNSDGNLMAVNKVNDTYPVGMGVTATRKIDQVNPQYKEAVNQLFTYKQMLAKQGFKNVSDKKAIEMMQQASANSASHYNLSNEQVSDRYGNDNFNPFRNPDGGYKDASKTAELEYQDVDGNWQGATEAQLAEYAGIKGETDTKGIRSQLSTMSDKELDYSGKQTKLRGSIMDKNGNSIPVRVNPSNTKVTKYSEPLLKTKQMLLKAGDSRIFFEDDNIGFTIKTAPQQIFNRQTGQTEIVNRIVQVIPDEENIKSKDYPVVMNILSNPNSDLEGNFLTLAKIYRDNGFVDNQIVYQKEKIK